MQDLFIAATNETPEVFLSKTEKRFSIKGMSLPENASGFYAPVLNWLEQYSKQPYPLTTVELKLTYLNTSSSKSLLDVFVELERIQLANIGAVVKIVWCYDTDDEDMEDVGRDFDDIIEIDFEFKEEEVDDEELDF